MNSLGIYFGPKTINIIEVRGKKIVNKAEVLQSTISSGDLEEKVPVEAKTAAILSFLKDQIRKSNITAKDVTICLSGKDLIIRTFEMPMMPREELSSAINFEVKKYIPFKVEDLISDSQVQFDKKNHTNLVLFVGIKKETLEKYVSILNQIGIKVGAIEYPAFSITRCLKLSGSSDKGIVGILIMDLKGEDEVNFTISENGYPLFSRDIVLSDVHGYMEKVEEASIVKILEKLKTEIRVSLDYYHRKFPNKTAKKICIVSGPEFQAEVKLAMSEIGLSIQFIDLSKYIDKTASYSLGVIKAYSAALSKTAKTKIKINLLSAKERARAPVKEKALQEELVSFFKDLRPDSRVIMLCLLIFAGVFGFGVYRINPLNEELNRIKDAQIKIPKIGLDVSYKDLAVIDSENKKKLEALDSLIKKEVYFTDSLNAVPKAVSGGLWLTNLSFNKQQERDAHIVLDGIVYLEDKDKEFEAVNEFRSNLADNPAFNKYFKKIFVTTIDRRNMEGIVVTNFSIECKTR